MKYIRTKDRIEAYNESCDISYVYQSIGGINIADTIEELCDMFILENEIKNEEPFTIMHRKIFETFRNAIKEAMPITKQNCFGAIWTDKGLIYVAKMNDKGELELL